MRDLINVSELITDSDFSQTFTVIRNPGHWEEGSWVYGTPVEIQIEGVITVANVSDVNMLPEGDRIKGSMTFHSLEQLYPTRGQNSNYTGVESTSDEIIWQGERYKIMQVYPYVDYGYWKALGVRMVGN